MGVAMDDASHSASQYTSHPIHQHPPTLAPPGYAPQAGYGPSAFDQRCGPSTGVGSIDASTGQPTDSAQRCEQVQKLLSKRLGPEYLSQRSGGGGTKLTYIEGWRVINLANEIFGYNGWFSEVKRLDLDFCDEDAESHRYNVGVCAIVKVWLKDGASHEDVGYGKAENQKSKAEALDKSRKEAVTDGLKRALRNFGSLLGNCLYDKEYLKFVSKIKAPNMKYEWSDMHRPQNAVAKTAPPPDLVAEPSECPPPAGPPIRSANSVPTKPSRVLPAPLPPSHTAARMTAPAMPRDVAPPPAPPARPAPAPVPDPINRDDTSTADMFGDDSDSLFADVETDLVAGGYPYKDESMSTEADDSGFVDSIPVDKRSAASTSTSTVKTPLQIQQARDEALRRKAQQAHAQPPHPAPTTGPSSRQHSAPAGKPNTATAAQLVRGANQNHPQRAQTVNLQTSRAPQVAAPAQPHTGLRRAAPPPRPPPPAHGVNPDISRPVHRTAGQLPPLNIGSVAGRIGGGGGGVGPLLAKTTAGHGVGEAFVSARGVKRVADVYEPTPPEISHLGHGLAGVHGGAAHLHNGSQRMPLGDLTVDATGEVKRPRMA